MVARDEPGTPAVAAAATPPEAWELRLYVAGQTPRSLAAIANLRDRDLLSHGSSLPPAGTGAR